MRTNQKEILPEVLNQPSVGEQTKSGEMVQPNIAVIIGTKLIEQLSFEFRYLWEPGIETLASRVKTSEDDQEGIIIRYTVPRENAFLSVDKPPRLKGDFANSVAPTYHPGSWQEGWKDLIVEPEKPKPANPNLPLLHPES